MGSTLPETNSIFEPENGCLEYLIRLPFGSRPIFRGLQSSFNPSMNLKNRRTEVKIFSLLPTKNGLHSRKLTCPIRRDYFNRKYIFQPLILRGHVSFPGSTWYVQESQTIMKCPQRMNQEIKDQKISAGIHMDCPIGCLCKPLKNMCVYIYIHVYPPWNDHISHLGKSNIASKVPAGTRGYRFFHKCNKFFH